MSDAEEDSSATTEKSDKKKKSKLPIILALAAVVLVGAAAAAGFFFAPKLAGGANASKAHEAEQEPEVPEKAPASVSVEPIVVDVRDADGNVHHLKVALSIELKEGVVEGDFRAFLPRGRESAIAYLRAHTFEDLTAADRFETVRVELGKRVSEAVGEKRAGRVLVTDFVAQ